MNVQAGPKAKQPSLGKFGIAWLVGLLGLTLVFHFGKFDDTTVLLPDRTGALEKIFWAAGLFGLISAAVGIWQSAELAPLRRIIVALAFWLEGAIAGFSVFDTVADLYLNQMDFPPGKTRSHLEDLQISRAYHTHGKNPSWNIQTMPIWSNMDITKDDYDYMLRHRRPGDVGNDADEISSNGYFCARVIVEETNENLRVMHAGQSFLPKGTVIVCPAKR
jgi:hypothetical protein